MKRISNCLVTLLVSLSFAAQAQGEYPAKPVKILVGYQAGGPTDLTARLLSARLQTALGQSFVVENKPGAGSNIVSEQLAASTPDGYTLMVAAASITWNSVLYKNTKFDPTKSYAPITKIMSSPAVLIVRPGLSVQNVADLVAMAKKDPKALSYASSGNGSIPHLNAESFKTATGIFMTHIPYRGANPALNDLLGGQVDVAFVTALSAIPFIKDGRLRALAVVSDKRLAPIPGVPTLKELGIKGVDLESWNGLFAPAGTPAAVVNKLAEATHKILRDPDVKKVFEEQASAATFSSPKEFETEINSESVRNQAFVKKLKITVD